MKIIMVKSVALSVTVTILLSVAVMTSSQQLSTSSRWIVNESTGERVKLACLNWVAHLEVMVAEGLSKQPVDVISRTIRDLGFNCVRLTWPLFLITNDSMASVTVGKSFLKLGLTESLAGFQENNPSLINLSLVDAFKVVVASIARNDLMIILDNHVSKPGWCCSNPNDGSGFFGEKYFDPDIWIKGLTKMATMFNGVTNVVAMSLRNELRGPKQNVNDWYRYMQMGAEAVHAANPKILKILSGLAFDGDLSFLRQTKVELSFTRKLVFEVHWYSFSSPNKWKGNPNEVCGQITGTINRNVGYLLDQGYPLFVSEFGVDQRGTNLQDNRYFGCFMGWAAEHDVDWALWTLAGSYYIREGKIGVSEVYGVYDSNWRDIRNSSVLERISVLQTPFQGPGGSQLSQPHKLIFHPATGLCVKGISLSKPLELGPCSEAEAWSYSSDKVLTIKDLYYCLQVDFLRKPVKLGLNCTELSSKWEPISDSKMHLASKLQDGSEVCLDVDSDDIIVTNTCKCLNRDKTCDPESQWFKIIDSNRERIEAKSIF